MAQDNAQFKEELRQRAQRAILTNALMRWESAVLIAITLLGSAGLGAVSASGAISWLWPVIGFGAGTVAWAAVFVSSLSDEQDNARAVAAALRDSYDPRRLRSPQLRGQMEKALGYRDLLARAIQNTREGILRDRLTRAIEPVDEWIEQIFGLASRVDAYQLDRVIQQDLKSVPESVANLKRRLEQERNSAVRATLEKTIGDTERQLTHLQHLQDTMQKAGYQLESTLAMLGTIYAQLQAIDVQATERGRDEELRAEINEQVQQLQDLGQAMDEVYYSRSAQAG
jgi:hypothetical protein